MTKEVSCDTILVKKVKNMMKVNLIMRKTIKKIKTEIERDSVWDKILPDVCIVIAMSVVLGVILQLIANILWRIP